MASWFLSFSRCHYVLGLQDLEKAKNLAGKVLRLIQDWLNDAEFGKNLASVSIQIAASANRPFEFPETRSAFHPLAQ
jgi:hypothetical protein